MFAFFIFVIHHVYSAVLVSWEERNGLIESIYSGYKFVPREDLIYSGYRFTERDQSEKPEDAEPG